MANCIVHNDKFKDLVEKSGLTSIKLEAMMDMWMSKNNTDVWPTLEQLGVNAEKSEEEVLEPISETEKVDEIYSPAFASDNDENSSYDESEEEVPADEFNQERVEFTPEETIHATEKSYANLTAVLQYQMNDIQDEIAGVLAAMKNADKAELKKLNARFGELSSKRHELTTKIKAAKELSNLWQVVDFGNQAIDEVRKLMANGDLTVKGLNYARRIVDFWIKAGVVKEGRFGHVLFGENGYSGVSEDIEKALNEISNNMQKISNKLIKPKDKQFIKQMVRKQLGNDISEAEITAAMKDISWMSKNMFAIADFESPLLSAVYSAMKRVDSDSAGEIAKTMAEFDAKLKAADKFLKPKNGNKYHIFYQEHNGQLTGDLVKIYSKKYDEVRDELLGNAQRTKRAEDWKAFKAWSKENETYVDIRLLFPEKELSPELQALADKHRTELISSIGQKQFNRIMNRIEANIELYNSAKMAYENKLYSDPNLLEDDRIQLLRTWYYENSPYVELDRRLGAYNPDGSTYEVSTRVGNEMVYANKGVKGIRTIPNKFNKDGSETEWYDSKYKEIAKNEETLDLYNYMYDMMDYMRSILPEYQRNHIGSNTMPFVQKSMAKVFSEGVGLGMAKLIEEIQKSVIVSNLDETDYDEIDFETGRAIKKVKVNSMMRTNKYIQDAVDIKAISYEAETGIKAIEADLARFRKEVIDESNSKRSFDLPTVMKAYMATMITHKHKLNTIDLIEAARGVFEGINEVVTSNAGIEQYSRGAQRQKVGLTRMNEVLNYTIDHFKNQPIHEISGKMFGTKTYTSAEKSEIAKLTHTKDLLKIQLDNGTLSQEEFDKRSKIIQSSMDRLGGYQYLSKYGENLLKYTQIKGMGFNAIAGGVNLTTGWMENSIRAADGRFFNSTQLGQSYRDVWSTIYDPKRKNEVTKKLVGIESRFRLVGDPSQELYRQEGKFTEIAYIITKKTEFVNVMAMAGAYLRNIPVTDNEGKKSNLYEAFTEDGKIKDGWVLDPKESNDDFLFRVEMQLHRLVQKSHGNYKDPLMAKSTILGQMAMQFRTWMPEMYKSRWGKSEGVDPILKKEFKGRWRSLTTLGGSEFNGNQFTAFDNIQYTLGQLLKKIAFQKTSFDGRMSEVDAANMKANLMELHFILGTILMMLILKAAIPDEDKKKNFTYNMMMNLIMRQQNDIMVFANPLTFEQINKNVLPVMGVLSDTRLLVNSIRGEFSDDDRRTGKSLTRAAGFVPGLNQGVRFFKYGAKEMVQQ